MAIQAEYGTTKQGEPVHQFTLKNETGMEVRCINYGCRLTHLFAPGKNGAVADVLLGYDDLAAYERDTTFQGAFIGRYANRIEGAAFSIGGKAYTLPANEGKNYLHGSFHQRVFNAEIIGNNSVTFTYESPDGEDGFPGNLWVGVTYTLTDENELILDYRAVSDADTYVNFTNHGYFNLAGTGSGDVYGHKLWLGSTSFLENNAESCPTGRILPAAGGAFDFTTEKPIGQDMGLPDPQLVLGHGYDHCFVLDKQRAGTLTPAAIVREETGGRTLHLYTTQPGVQFYTGNYLNPDVPGKGGKPLAPHSGFCLETQHFPCSPSHPEFPSTLLPAKDKFHETTILKFE